MNLDEYITFFEFRLVKRTINSSISLMSGVYERKVAEWIFSA